MFLELIGFEDFILEGIVSRIDIITFVFVIGLIVFLLGLFVSWGFSGSSGFFVSSGFSGSSGFFVSSGLSGESGVWGFSLVSPCSLISLSFTGLELDWSSGDPVVDWTAHPSLPSIISPSSWQTAKFWFFPIASISSSIKFSLTLAPYKISFVKFEVPLRNNSALSTFSPLTILHYQHFRH